MERLLPICLLVGACAAGPRGHDTPQPALAPAAVAEAPVNQDAPAGPEPVPARALFDLLDGDSDGVLLPFEVLDALLLLEADGEALERDRLADLLAEAAARDAEELAAFFALGDEDGDGLVPLNELDGMMASMLAGADADGDGALSLDELGAAELDDTEAMVRAEAAGAYAELTDMLGDPAELSGVPALFREELAPFDADGDGTITLAEVEELIRAELDGATFEVDGHVARMRGVIGATTPARVLEMLVLHPGVETLVLVDVPGSMDDIAMLRAARYVRRAGLGTHVPEDGEVASGGTDFFLSGVRRSAGEGARFGIHSWAGGPVAPLDLPRDHEEHDKYLDYYAEMGIPSAFYWRTLEAAPAEDIHWMTPDELASFEFITEEAPRLP